MSDDGEGGTAGDEVFAAVDHAEQALGGFDVMVNNAGIFIAKPFTEYTDADYDAITGVNSRGFFELTRAAIRTMEAQGDGGHVVTISTSLVDQANSQVPSALASLTKGGLNAATRALAVEYGTRGIRANAVALGIIHTPMHAPETHEFLSALHPVGHMGDISDVVDGVLYLENAKFVTGEILHVDGGQSAGQVGGELGGGQGPVAGGGQAAHLVGEVLRRDGHQPRRGGNVVVHQHRDRAGGFHRPRLSARLRR